MEQDRTFGLIYKATSPSGKCYIGQTIEELRIRKYKHKYAAYDNKRNKYYYPFSYAIRKYGFDNFQWEILHSNIPIEDLNKLEQEAIMLFSSVDNGYNATYGGAGKTKRYSLATREKMRQKRLGFKFTEETKIKMSKSKLGRKLSLETKKKMSEAHLRKSPEEQRANRERLRICRTKRWQSYKEKQNA